MLADRRFPGSTLVIDAATHDLDYEELCDYLDARFERKLRQLDLTIVIGFATTVAIALLTR